MNALNILKISFIFMALGLSAQALADSAEEVCASFEGVRRSNCVIAFQQIPNKGAVAYTFKYWQANSGSLKDSSCVTHGHDIAHKGIRNTCQVLINDIRSTYKGNPNRANAYFVDLCATSPQSVVKKIYVNKGTGTNAYNYSDREGLHTTTPGAFLTGTKIISFIPYTMSAAYQGIRKLLGFIPGLDLVGVQSTNNHTSEGKPMHVSGYKSSWGCPSLNPADVWIMRKLASNGPSLVMNYGPDQFHPQASVSNCRAVPEGGGRVVGSVRATRPKGIYSRVKGRLQRHGRRHGYGRGRRRIRPVSPNNYRHHYQHDKGAAR